MRFISIKVCVYVEPSRISSKLKHRLSDKETSRCLQVSSSSFCKYKLLQKADTLLESLYHPGKVGRELWVQERRRKKCILYKKWQMYFIN